MLSFAQVNLLKATHATVLLGHALQGKSQTINLITEPHTTMGRITGMPGGVKIIADRTIRSNQPGPRAGIIATKDLTITAMESWCNRDCAVAISKIHGRQTILASIYLDITKPVIPDWLEGLLTMINNKKLPVIIGMDSNAHSSLYGPDNNTRGDQLEDFILQHSLEVQNRGNEPTFETQRGNTHIATHT